MNWSAVNAIATAFLAVGLLGTVAAAVFAAQQVREARQTRSAQMAVEFFRRWSEDDLVQARQFVASFKSSEELAEAYAGYVAANAPEAYLLHRELDFFEQLAALESMRSVNLELIELMLGPILVERWELWRAALEKAHGPGSYPLFAALVQKVRAAPRSARQGPPPP